MGDNEFLDSAPKQVAKQGRRAVAINEAKHGTPSTAQDGSLIERSSDRKASRANLQQQSQRQPAGNLLLDDDLPTAGNDVSADDWRPDKKSVAPPSGSVKPTGQRKSTWDAKGQQDDYDDQQLMAAGKMAKKTQAEGEVGATSRQKVEDSDGPEKDSDADIPQILELEDTHAAPVDADNDAVVATIAPGIRTKVATFREMEEDLQKHLPFLTLDGEIDLKPLTKYLIPAAQVEESDVGWDWEVLYAEVASELLNETAETLQQAQQNASSHRQY